MDGLQNILNEISASADKSAADIVAEAEKEALRIIERAEKEAGGEAEKKISEASAKAEAIDRAAKSEVSVFGKKEELAAERALVGRTLEEAKKILSELDEKAYFDYIERFVKKNANKNKKGLLKLNARDLKRLPADFGERIAACGLAVSKEPAAISGGAVISYGEIEINGSFESVMDIDGERLGDVACDALFGKRGGPAVD